MNLFIHVYQFTGSSMGSGPVYYFKWWNEAWFNWCVEESYHQVVWRRCIRNLGAMNRKKMCDFGNSRWPCSGSHSPEHNSCTGLNFVGINRCLFPRFGARFLLKRLGQEAVQPFFVLSYRSGLHTLEYNIAAVLKSGRIVMSHIALILWTEI